MDNIESDDQGRGEGIISDTIDESVEHRNDVGDISDNFEESDEHLTDGDDDSDLLDGSDSHQSDRGNMRNVQLLGSIRIIICCTRICQCNLGKIRGWQRPYSVKCGSNVIGGPASLYFKTKEDFLCFGDYSGVSRIRHTQDV
uniref:DDB1-and CUL4-associated factor 8 n=1 Tax=Strongyloides papillosus TaxID=174720 RepID=A0A0N5BQZ1_STREA